MTQVSPTVRRDRRFVVAGLLGTSGLAWLYLVTLAGGMEGMSDMASMRRWTPSVFLLMLGMWVVMMVAMMAPSAAPVTLVFAAVARKARAGGSPLPPAAVFVVGYLTIWALFSFAATIAQMLLERSSLVSSAMTAAGPVFAGSLLLVAGLYQFTPLKQTCLQNCRSPVEFLTQQWRSSTVGVFTLGARVGVHCLGCCWMLMTLLFVGGVMNLLWVAAIAFFLLLEKALPAGQGTSSIAGAALTAVGAGVLGHAAIP